MGNFLSKAKATVSGSSEKMSGPAAFKHYAKAQSSFKPPLIANENAFLGDVYSRSVSSSDLTLPFLAVVPRADTRLAALIY